MSTTLTKSDYLKFLECPEYLWFAKNKPSILVEKELSDFDKQLIENGIEVEAWARKLFPSGVLVESREEQAVIDTKKLLEENKKIIFQATFEVDSLYVMVDILEWDEKNNYWIINEVKASSSKEKKKEKNIFDAGFQYHVLTNAEMNVSKVNLIEINKEFRKNGDIEVVKLLKIDDITDQILEKQEKIASDAENMKRITSSSTEPRDCECLYKSRNNHCPATPYLHSNIPEYSVHDLPRISKKKLEPLIEGDYLSILDIQEDADLTDIQRDHVAVAQSGKTINHSSKIKEELDKVEYPIYFLDYETYPTAVPVYDGCRPYQQIPFQFSLHVQKEPSGDIQHFEYLHEDGGVNPMKYVAEELTKYIDDTGSIVVWNKTFERGCNEDIADDFEEYRNDFIDYNERLFDLMDIFQKNMYVHKDFKGKYSIKKVLPVFDPELSYKDLAVQDGSMAMSSWKKLVFSDMSEPEKEQLKSDMLKYCKLDTWAMVRIYQELLKLI